MNFAQQLFKRSFITIVAIVACINLVAMESNKENEDRTLTLGNKFLEELEIFAPGVGKRLSIVENKNPWFGQGKYHYDSSVELSDDGNKRILNLQQLTEIIWHHATAEQKALIFCTCVLNKGVERSAFHSLPECVAIFFNLLKQKRNSTNENEVEVTCNNSELICVFCAWAFKIDQNINDWGPINCTSNLLELFRKNLSGIDKITYDWLIELSKKDSRTPQWAKDYRPPTQEQKTSIQDIKAPRDFWDILFNL